MTFTINADDARTIHALQLAAEAGQWLVCRTRDGQDAFGVASQSTPGRYYVVTQSSCDCPDFRRDRRPAASAEDHLAQRACKHILAVRLHCELVRAQQQQSRPTSAVMRSRGHLRLVSNASGEGSRSAG